MGPHTHTATNTSNREELEEEVDVNFKKAKARCIRCNISDEGPLLHCAVPTCPLSFHPQCAPPHHDHESSSSSSSTTTPDHHHLDASFYCPHCAYSRYLSLSDQALHSLNSAKQRLSHFLTTTTPTFLTTNTHQIHHAPSQPPLNHLHHHHTTPNEVDDDTTTANEDAAAAADTDDDFLASAAAKGKGKLKPLQNHLHVQDDDTANEDDDDDDTANEVDDDDDDDTANEDDDDDDYLASAKGKGKGKRLPTLPSSIANCTIPKAPKVKRVLWTSQEEEMLKEGIYKFASDYKSIPWKQILEFGSHVFDSSRNPESLRNKWKNNLAKDCSPLANM